jgi:hypothetical protein
MKFIKKATDEVFSGDHVVGKWADGSDKTVEELYKIGPNVDYSIYSNPNGARNAEIFDLTCRLLVSFASAGIKPNPRDCVEIAKLTYKLKDTEI